MFQEDMELCLFCARYILGTRKSAWHVVGAGVLAVGRMWEQQ